MPISQAAMLQTTTTSPSALFQDVLARYPSLDEPDIPEALQTLSSCAELVRRLRLFSSNEELSDISTRDLLLLLVDAYRADLLQRQRTKGPVQRKAVVQQSKVQYESFLQLCEMYDLIGELDRNYLKTITAPASMSADQKRMLKIQRSKANRSATASLSALHSMLAQQQAKMRRPTITVPAVSGLLSSMSLTPVSDTPLLRIVDGEDVEQDDEHVSREFVLQLVKHWTYKAVNDIISLSDELPHLEHMLKLQQEQLQQPNKPQNENDSSNKLDFAHTQMPRTGPLLDKKGRPLRPFTLVSADHAQRLRDQVFQPGHRLPTMTIDSYLQAERERGNMLSGGGQGPTKGNDKGDENDNDYEAIETAMYKTRAFDDFKDDNPRGWGNRKGKG